MRGWDGIEEFVAVAQYNSFKLAAQALGVSTSHVSRAVMRLENSLNSALFFRTTRQVTLTETGRSLLDHCKQLIRDRDEAFALIGGAGDPLGELRVTCATALGERFVSPIIRRFMQDHPSLSVKIDFSNRLKDIIAEGYDLAIRTGQLEDSRLVRTRVATRQYVVCAAKDYVAANGAPQDLNDLGDHACIVGTSDYWLFEVDGEIRNLRPKSRWKSNSGMSVLDACLAGMGVCQLPEFYVRDAMADGRLVPMLEAFKAEPEPIWAVYPQRRHLLPKVSRLVDRLKRELDAAINQPVNDVV